MTKMEKLGKFNCRTIVMANTARKAKGGRRCWKINNRRRVLLSLQAKHCHINRLATVVTRCLGLCEKCLFTKARCNKLATSWEQSVQLGLCLGLRVIAKCCASSNSKRSGKLSVLMRRKLKRCNLRKKSITAKFPSYFLSLDAINALSSRRYLQVDSLGCFHSLEVGHLRAK